MTTAYVTREITFRSEALARATRRTWIRRGARVSLIAYDPDRELYTYDVYNVPIQERRAVVMTTTIEAQLSIARELEARHEMTYLQHEKARDRMVSTLQRGVQVQSGVYEELIEADAASKVWGEVARILAGASAGDLDERIEAVKLHARRSLGIVLYPQSTSAVSNLQTAAVAREWLRVMRVIDGL